MRPPAAWLALLLPIGLLISAPTARAQLATEWVAGGLEQPIFLTAPAGDDRLFILEQRGLIRIWKDGAVLPRPFLDIDPLVHDIAGPGDERGLLGLAFHPDYQINRRFYVYYVDPGNDVVIAEHYASSDPDSAVVDSSRLILEVEHWHGGHNGGTLAFGPNDGYLYIGLGDGGAFTGGDPFNRAQNPDSLFGKMLRLDIDVDSTYAIPPDNPFVADPGARDEIWALGFRNPYRWSFDRLTGDMYIADVGEADWEEINFEPDTSAGGRNYGWRLMEGESCFDPPTGCNLDSTLVLPLYQYPHDGFTCAVTGGYVYRGSRIPWLTGTYFFADFCSEQIWSFRLAGEDTSEFRERTEELGAGQDIQRIAAFGEDGFGELYIVDRGFDFDPTGEIYRIVDPTPVAAPAPPTAGTGLFIRSVAPNPFAGSTRIEAVIDGPGRVTFEIANVRGRVVRTFQRDAALSGVVVVTWDGRDAGGVRVASGVFYLRARWGERIATAKIIHRR